MKARSMLFDIFGDYVYPNGGQVWIGTLIKLAELLGVSEQAVRSAVTRMVTEGWLERRDAERRGWYALARKGLDLIEEGRARIFRSQPGQWDGKWCFLTYSVPESERELRDRLRKELTWMGFGALSSGVYVSPWDLRDWVASLVARYQLDGRVHVFHGDYAWPGDVRELISRCWDLDGLNREYEAFVHRYGPLLQRDRRRIEEGSIDNQECFVSRFLLIYQYRKFPFRDPSLPRELLPSGWMGLQAAEIFNEYHDLLSAGATAFYRELCGLA